MAALWARDVISLRGGPAAEWMAIRLSAFNDSRHVASARRTNLASVVPLPTDFASFGATQMAVSLIAQAYVAFECRAGSRISEDPDD